MKIDEASGREAQRSNGPRNLRAATEVPNALMGGAISFVAFSLSNSGGIF
jgi:hypothetical protein